MEAPANDAPEGEIIAGEAMDVDRDDKKGKDTTDDVNDNEEPVVEENEHQAAQ